MLFMPDIFTLSAYETSAEQFFDALLCRKADLVLDVRLKNTNQLCGFTRQKDLEYLIPQITGAAYVHDLRFAPTPELLDRYRKHWNWIGWEEYREQYDALMRKRGAEFAFRSSYGTYSAVCILGTATKKRRSHSEALVELLTDKSEKECSI
jgi:hypothetical protein